MQGLHWLLALMGDLIASTRGAQGAPDVLKYLWKLMAFVWKEKEQF